ncbi:OB-fold protein [Treponema pedis]|nr:hypothetical protein [Treponema pedis]
MKVWLNKCVVIVFVYIIFFTSCCVNEKNMYYVTSEQLITEFRNNFNQAVEKYKDSIIIVEGTVSAIDYPKDGFFLDECIMCLGGTGYDSKKRLGDSVDCKMKNRESKTYIDAKITIKGEFEKANLLLNELYVALKNCEIKKRR